MHRWQRIIGAMPALTENVWPIGISRLEKGRRSTIYRCNELAQRPSPLFTLFRAMRKAKAQAKQSWRPLQRQGTIRRRGQKERKRIQGQPRRQLMSARDSLAGDPEEQQRSIYSFGAEVVLGPGGGKKVPSSDEENNPETAPP